jgi:hypothetical protein
MNRSSLLDLRLIVLGCRFFLEKTIVRHVYRFLACLFILQGSFLQAQVVVTLGTGKITGSVIGVNAGNASVSGLPLGISFDLMVTASSIAAPTMSVSNHPDGTGVVGGSNVEIDNRNNLDPNDDESLTFTLANVTGLDGQSLKISGIVTRSLGTSFLHSQESIYRFAQAMGETRNQYADAEGIAGTGANGYSAPLVKYSYRNDQVVHYKVTGGDHGLRVGGSTVYADEAQQIIANFLLQ